MIQSALTGLPWRLALFNPIHTTHTQSITPSWLWMMPSLLSLQSLPEKDGGGRVFRNLFIAFLYCLTAATSGSPHFGQTAQTGNQIKMIARILLPSRSIAEHKINQRHPPLRHSPLFFVCGKFPTHHRQRSAQRSIREHASVKNMRRPMPSKTGNNKNRKDIACGAWGAEWMCSVNVGHLEDWIERLRKNVGT